ncbi:hypothetical protein D3C75_1320790 [compost metagenome]
MEADLQGDQSESLESGIKCGVRVSRRRVDLPGNPAIDRCKWYVTAPRGGYNAHRLVGARYR